MIRNFKGLGFVMVAFFAFGALSASAASAGDKLTTSPAYQDAILTGTSHDNVFEFAESKFECTTARFAATAESSAEEVTGPRNLRRHKKRHAAHLSLQLVVRQCHGPHKRLRLRAHRRDKPGRRRHRRGGLGRVSGRKRNHNHIELRVITQTSPDPITGIPQV